MQNQERKKIALTFTNKPSKIKVLNVYNSSKRENSLNVLSCLLIAKILVLGKSFKSLRSFVFELKKDFVKIR